MARRCGSYRASARRKARWAEAVQQQARVPACDEYREAESMSAARRTTCLPPTGLGPAPRLRLCHVRRGGRLALQSHACCGGARRPSCMAFSHGLLSVMPTLFGGFGHDFGVILYGSLALVHPFAFAFLPYAFFNLRVGRCASTPRRAPTGAQHQVAPPGREAPMFVELRAARGASLAEGPSLQTCTPSGAISRNNSCKVPAQLR